MHKKTLILLLFFCLLASAAAARWDALPASIPPTTSNLNACFFTSSIEGIVVGGTSTAGTVLRTTSGGASFTSTALGTANFNDVIFATTLEGYLLGDSGQLWVTSDGGNSFTLAALPPELAAANFRKGAFNGAKRSFAAFVSSSGKSYTFNSTDSGTTFASSAVAAYEIVGVALNDTHSYIWGIPSVGQYTILMDATVEVWRGTQSITDITFVNNLIGYATGSGGLLMKTTNGGTSWSNLNSGVTNPLNSAFFLSSNNGWIVGEGRTILFTTDEGNSFIPYIDPTFENSLRDVFAFLEAPTSTLELPVVDAYIAAANGMVYKLSSPQLTSVAPASAMQGWVGEVSAEGSGFMAGAELSFSGTQILVFTTTVESDNHLHSTVIVGSQAGTGSREIAVTNIDRTYIKKPSAFNVTANPGLVNISNIWFSPDGGTHWNKDQFPFQSIVPTTGISFEIVTTSATGEIAKATLNAKALLFNDGFYTNVISIPSTAITFEPSANRKSATVSFILPQALPAGVGTLELYAEDNLGEVGRQPVSVEVASASPAVPVPTGTLEGAGANDLGTGFVVGTSWDPTQGPATIQLRFKPGVYLPEGFEVVILTGPGGDVAFRKHYSMPLHASAQSPHGIWQNIQLNESDFGANFRNCIALGLIIDRSQGGKVVGKFKVPIFAKF